MISQRTQTLKRVVILVTLLNLSYFGVEFAVALAIGSVSLFADSIDFLEDASVNFLILVALGWSATRRARVGMLLACILLVPALAMVWALWNKFVAPVPPAPVPLALTGFGALVINFGCALMLARFRHHAGSLTRAAFLSARNDAIANVAIIVAGIVTSYTQSVWPDVIVGLGVAAMNADAARTVWKAAREENRAAAPMIPSSGPLGARSWVGFIAMSIGMFMAILDVQIVASSLPEIQAGLAIPLDRLSWVQTAYLMAEIVAIPLTGWLTRVMSTRGAFVACVLGFTAASMACAVASGFWWLVSARVLQGFCGGFLIPLAFSAVFVMFDGPARIRATMIAGIMAMLAPTLGPTIGGFITAHFSWHWLFLINLPPGIVVALLAGVAVTVDRPHWRHFGAVDLAAVPLLAGFLAALQWVLSEAPRRGWSDPAMLALMALCALCGAGTVRRCLRHDAPLVDFGVFRNRNFALACWFSFVLGGGLYGATYLLPLFLGLVRGHDSLEIGTIMMLTGAAQLAMAPIATLLERCIDARLLIAAGYGLLAAGFLGNGEMTPATDFWGLAWQQVARGCGFMLCLLPTTSLALGGFEAKAVPNASGLFNLMRNLGGAIGLAAIDTVIAQRAPAHVATLVARLQAGDVAAARFVGLPVEEFSGKGLGPIDPATRDFIAPLLERAGLAEALNDAWLLIGGFVLLSLLMLPFLRRASAATGTAVLDRAPLKGDEIGP